MGGASEFSEKPTVIDFELHRYFCSRRAYRTSYIIVINRILPSRRAYAEAVFLKLFPASAFTAAELRNRVINFIMKIRISKRAELNYVSIHETRSLHPNAIEFADNVFPLGRIGR